MKFVPIWMYAMAVFCGIGIAVCVGAMILIPLMALPKWLKDNWKLAKQHTGYYK